MENKENKAVEPPEIFTKRNLEDEKPSSNIFFIIFLFLVYLASYLLFANYYFI